MRLLFLLIMTFISLVGRDNPFFPSDPNEKQTVSSNRIDNLKPFSEQKISLPNSARAIKKIIISYQNLDGSISNEELELNNAIDWHEPFIISQKNKSTSGVKKLAAEAARIKADFIEFMPMDKSMKIKTADKLLRNFMLTSPHRIVLDFARDTSFKPKRFKVNNRPFSQIRMGNHDKYYRVVIELDGTYRHKLQISKGEYTVVCY